MPGSWRRRPGHDRGARRGGSNPAGDGAPARWPVPWPRLHRLGTCRRGRGEQPRGRPLRKPVDSGAVQSQCPEAIGGETAARATATGAAGPAQASPRQCQGAAGPAGHGSAGQQGAGSGRGGFGARRRYRGRSQRPAPGARHRFRRLPRCRQPEDRHRLAPGAFPAGESGRAGAAASGPRRGAGGAGIRAGCGASADAGSAPERAGPALCRAVISRPIHRGPMPPDAGGSRPWMPAWRMRGPWMPGRDALSISSISSSPISRPVSGPSSPSI